MNRVFVVNEPLKFEQGKWIRYINLRPARDHGELVFLLPAGPLADDPRPSIDILSAGLSDFTAEDYLLLVGDPRAIAWAAAIAADKTGGLLRLLQWHRDQKRYDSILCDVFPAGEDENRKMEEIDR